MDKSSDFRKYDIEKIKEIINHTQSELSDVRRQEKKTVPIAWVTGILTLIIYIITAVLSFENGSGLWRVVIISCGFVICFWACGLGIIASKLVEYIFYYKLSEYKTFLLKIDKICRLISYADDILNLEGNRHEKIEVFVRSYNFKVNYDSDIKSDIVKYANEQWDLLLSSEFVSRNYNLSIGTWLSARSVDRIICIE